MKHKGNQLVKVFLLSFSLMFFRICGQQPHSGCVSSVYHAIIVTKNSCPVQEGLGDLSLVLARPLNAV